MKQTAADHDDLLSIGEAARRLGIAPRTLTAWIQAGRVRCVRLSPRTTRVPAAEIARLIEQGST